MNRRDVEFTEKKKKGIAPKVRLVRVTFFLILIASLIPFAIISAMYLKNRIQYSISLNEFSYKAQDLTLLETSCAKYEALPVENREICSLWPLMTDSASVFEEALKCINTIFCTVKYDASLNYPVYISYDKENRLSYFVLYDPAIGADD